MSQLLCDTPIKGSSPPVVHIPREIRQSNKVSEAYGAALDEHGSVIIVPRHGRNEYVIDPRYAHEVLTDTKNFIFETAVFDRLHLGLLPLSDKETLITGIDSLVKRNVQPQLDAIIEQILPVLQSYFANMANDIRSLSGDSKFVEISDVCHKLQLAVAHAMVVMILGQEHASSKTATHFGMVAAGMAKMTGLNENIDEWTMFPRLWILFTGLSAVFFTIIPTFFFGIAPMLWRSRKIHLEKGLAARHGDFVPLFDILLTRHYHEKSGLAAVRGFLQSAVACVTLIFASIHQTGVMSTWILVKLAQMQDDYLPAIREEWESVNSDGGTLTVKKLSQLTLLDSFIREVMRTKGDLWGPLRYTTRAIRIGPYVLPKNALCFVLVSRAHSNPDEAFDGFRWHKQGRRAVQGSPEFLTFSLGKWACPGRQLAVHEIKILLYMFFSKFDVKLKEGSFRIIDPINTTSIAPEATLLLRLRKDDSSIEISI
ncbi:cytochrome P450 [Nemania abortiva]|nr:cytochrome P450 [Nemania abortiva]